MIKNDIIEQPNKAQRVIEMAKKFKKGFAIGKDMDSLEKEKVFPVLGDALVHVDTKKGEEIFHIKWDGITIENAELID